MSSPNDGSPKPPPGGEPKKPSAIIDLKATEVKGGDPKAAQKQVEGPTSESKSTASAVPPVGGSPSSKSESGTSAAAGGAKSSTSPASSSSAGKPTGPQPASAAGTVPPASAAAAKLARGSSVASMASHAVAGLVGGLLALLAADTLGPQLGLPGHDKTATETLQKRIGELEQRVGAAARASDQTAAVAKTVAAAEKRLADLEQTNARLAQLEAQNTALGEQTRALKDAIAKSPASDDARVARMEERLATMAAAAGTDNRVPQLAAVTGKLADLESTIGTQLGQARTALRQDLDQRLAPIAEASEAARSGAQRLDRELQALKTEAARLAERLEAGKLTDDRLQQSILAVEQQATAVKASLDGLNGQLAAELKGVARPADVAGAVGPLSAKIGQIEASLKDVVKSEEDRRSSAERIVLSLELGNLKRAVDRGGSYASELASVQKISGGKLPLAPLTRFKDSGVATTADLADEFRSVANAILDAETVGTDAGVVDRLLAGAKSVVRVRKVGHEADDKSPEAVVGRMQEAVRDGRLAAVLDNAKQLGERGRTAARVWLDKVEARYAVEQAIAEVDQQLKAAIGGSAPAKGVN
jgi:hypothetical protein